MSLWYDKTGKPLTLSEWADHFEDINYRFIKRTEVGRFQIITVWSGIDEGFGDDPKPLIFGTVPFDREIDDYLMEEEVYAPTEEEAVAQHDALVLKAKEWKGD